MQDKCKLVFSTPRALPELPVLAQLGIQPAKPPLQPAKPPGRPGSPAPPLPSGASADARISTSVVLITAHRTVTKSWGNLIFVLHFLPSNDHPISVIPQMQV